MDCSEKTPLSDIRAALHSKFTTHEMHPLCYVHMKVHYPKIVYSKFESAALEGCVVILVSFNFNPLRANLTIWPNTLKKFVAILPTHCLSVFDHFVGLALKGLRSVSNMLLFILFNT